MQALAIKALKPVAIEAARQPVEDQLAANKAFLDKMGVQLTWEDIKAELEKINSVEDLKALKANPVAPLVNVVLDQAQPKLEPELEKQGIKWDEVSGLAKQVDSPDKLRDLVKDPAPFLKQLKEKGAVVAVNAVEAAAQKA